MNKSSTWSWSDVSWINALFILLTPVITLGLLITYLYQNGFQWPQWALAIFYYYLTGIAITAGYHRLFAHKTFKANSFARFVFLFFGAGAFQNSVLKWAADHRRHHKKSDTDADPYTINKGFFYAHMGWILLKEDPRYPNDEPLDLKRDKLVMWQHKYYLPIAVASGFVVPTLLGWALGSAFGGFVLAGLTRMVFCHHCTFFVNSLAHYWGKKTYSAKITARDNYIVAFFTYGEGYHNFHHRFEGDYRNGLRWYHWDPTKWTIQTLKAVGAAYDLKKVPDTEILKAKLRTEEMRLVRPGEPSKYDEMLKTLREKVEETQLNIRKLKDDYDRMKSEFSESGAENLAKLKTELRIAKIEFRIARNRWRSYVRVLSLQN